MGRVRGGEKIALNVAENSSGIFLTIRNTVASFGCKTWRFIQVPLRNGGFSEVEIQK